MHWKIRRLADAIHRQPSKRYLTYMRSPQWQIRRREHLESAEGWCEVCKKAKACQVHHFTYVRLGYESPEDLCAVCVECHHRLHTSILGPPANDNEAQLVLDFKKKDDDEAA